MKGKRCIDCIFLQKVTIITPVFNEKKEVPMCRFVSWWRGKKELSRYIKCSFYRNKEE